MPDAGYRAAASGGTPAARDPGERPAGRAPIAAARRGPAVLGPRRGSNVRPGLGGWAAVFRAWIRVWAPPLHVRDTPARYVWDKGSRARWTGGVAEGDRPSVFRVGAPRQATRLPLAFGGGLARPRQPEGLARCCGLRGRHAAACAEAPVARAAEPCCPDPRCCTSGCVSVLNGAAIAWLFKHLFSAEAGLVQTWWCVSGGGELSLQAGKHLSFA